MKTFYKGALLLVIAAFIGECLEFFINMVLARELGEEGLGLYMSIFPSIIFIAVLASMELPISISKFIAEKDKKYHRSMLQHAVRFVLAFTAIFVVAAVFVLPQLPIFDRYHPLIQWLVILLIPMISFSSIARGYLMGSHEMGKIAFAGFLRKAVQLALLVVVYQFFQFEQEVSILISLCTLVASELVMVVYIISVFFTKVQKLKYTPSAMMSGKKVREHLLAVSVPYTGLRIFHAATFAIKPFLISFALMRAGLTESLALIQYGKLAGVAFTIGFFPAFIAHSLLIVLIPTVSEAYAKGDLPKLQNLLRQVMLLTLAYGVPSVLIFYFYAEPLTSLFFEASPAIGYLQILVPYFFFHFFVIPMQAYLIGLGLVKEAFFHSVWSTFVSFVLMFVLGSMEQLQMNGIILGMNTGVVVLTFMHYLTICKKIGVSVTLRPY
ncbi:polysaccharide biosynthesis protein [Bacillus sp. FJAT-45350]|uniref:polysaccharide biosynthesis protein n=1 Tax=Bacillus sp. FJAT-45350 TaxID=2011014 RepID=UPI000BB922E3|nr:polysaccharide biosynthesis protein [Bacillus sp. FJAT-45350]